MKANMFVFMGGQGSGKGTFAKKMMDLHKYNYIETGAMLRALPAESRIYKKIVLGELVEDEDLFELMSNNIKKETDTILDGFPRTIGQAKWLVNNYADDFSINVIYLNITEETMINHINKRILEGGNRSDDKNMEAVHKRIQAFKEVTIPAISWLSTSKDIKFFDISLSSDDIEKNFQIILSAIN